MSKEKYENEALPPQAGAVDTIAVEQQKINPRLNDYIAELAQNPFTHDMVTDPGHVIYDLAQFWPKMRGRNDEARELWRHIAEAVEAVPNRLKSSKVALRVTMGSSTVVPGALPVPKEAAVLATFDVVEGMLRRYSVPAAREAPLLEDMGIAAGLLILCQEVPPLINNFKDNRPVAMGAGDEALYGTRNKDRIITGDDPVDKVAASPRIPGLAPSPPNLADMPDEEKTSKRAHSEDKVPEAVAEEFEKTAEEEALVDGAGEEKELEAGESNRVRENEEITRGMGETEVVHAEEERRESEALLLEGERREQEILRAEQGRREQEGLDSEESREITRAFRRKRNSVCRSYG